MKGQLMQEIQRLTRLIEQRKKMASQTLGCNKSSYCSLENAEKINLKSIDDYDASLSNVHAHLDRQFATANVHVNPNFKVQNPVIYINPRMQTASRIHVNPRIIKDVSKLNDGKYSYSNVKCSVYVNPKLMTKLSSSMRSKIMDKRTDVSTTTEKNNCSHLKYVKNTDTLNVGSSTMNTLTMGDRRFNNSSVVVLSRRKLIRVRRTVKGSSVITPTVTPAKTKKFLRSPFIKIKSAPLKTVKRSIIEINTLRSSGRNDHTFEPNEIIAKCSRYKIDRTNHLSSLKVKGGSMENNTAIITVGGIPYKSSRNQLVHGNLSLKKKRVPKNDKFIVAKSGKNLHRLKVVKDTNNRIAHHSIPHLGTRKEDKCGISLSQKTNYKNSMSTKAKRRSIQILWNKMRKNNQPCLLFQKFGYCANYKSGICPKLHDRKQVSLCKRFLQGKCFADNCSLSHDVGPEKMPTCKYFLEGCCTRDACPYLHVKMSSNTLICMDFLKGYCAKGNECNRRHEFMCPEFDKSRKCSKGKYCPYPHKPQTSAIGHTDKHLQTEPKGSRNKLNVIAVVGVNNNNTTTTNNTTATTTTTTNTTITTITITSTAITTATATATTTATATIANNNNNGNIVGHTKTIISDAVHPTIVPSTHESRLRYYERRDALNDDINERKETIIKKINIMKGVEIVQRSHMRHDLTTDASMRAMSSRTGFIEVKEYTCNQSAKTDCGKPMKRRPIGSLPAYIPID